MKQLKWDFSLKDLFSKYKNADLLIFNKKIRITLHAEKCIAFSLFKDKNKDSISNGRTTLIKWMQYVYMP